MAWAAHVGGFVFGVIVGLLLRGKARDKQDFQWQHWESFGGHNLPPPYRDERRFGGRDWTPF